MRFRGDHHADRVKFELDRGIPGSDRHHKFDPIFGGRSGRNPSITLFADKSTSQRAIGLGQFEIATNFRIGRINLDLPLTRDLYRRQFARLGWFDGFGILMIFITLCPDHDMFDS